MKNIYVVFSLGNGNTWYLFKDKKEATKFRKNFNGVLYVAKEYAILNEDSLSKKVLENMYSVLENRTGLLEKFLLVGNKNIKNRWSGIKDFNGEYALWNFVENAWVVGTVYILRQIKK